MFMATPVACKYSRVRTGNRDHPRAMSDVQGGTLFCNRQRAVAPHHAELISESAPTRRAQRPTPSLGAAQPLITEAAAGGHFVRRDFAITHGAAVRQANHRLASARPLHGQPPSAQPLAVLLVPLLLWYVHCQSGWRHAPGELPRLR